MAESKKPMTRQQMNYIRECLQARKRRLEKEYCVQEPKPIRVKRAERTIEEWRTSSYEKTAKTREVIGARISRIEEQLILDSIDGSISDALAALDNWNPTESE